MTYLMTWLTIVIVLIPYNLVRQNEFESFFCAAFWSGFALIMHALTTG